MVHTAYLSRNDADPPRAMAEHLRNAIGDNFGTVFVWYEPFEKTRNTEMGEMFPEHAEFFETLNANVFDLMKIFADRLYVHPEFKGKSSIKKVLPVLVPDLSYKSLGIGDGLTATIQWFRAAKWDTLTQPERDRRPPGVAALAVHVVGVTARAADGVEHLGVELVGEVATQDQRGGERHQEPRDRQQGQEDGAHGNRS